MNPPNVVMIARCPVHGLHGQRDRCFECGGPVEQVAMVKASDVPSQKWTTSMVIEELYAERDFLFERSMQAGICRFDQDRFTGISSNALVRFAFTGEEPEVNGRDWRYPSDASDLAACEHTYAMAPAHLQPRMLPLLEKYRAHIQAKAEEQARRREGAA